MSKTTIAGLDRAEIDRVIASLRASAVEREQGRILPADEVRALVAAGIGAIRVPEEFGGAGASIRELAAVLIELAAADSNLTMILRGHLGFIEDLRLRPRSAAVEELLTAAGRGEFFGPAGSELGGASLFTLSTRLQEEDGRFFLEGEKYYTTGSLFADWVWVLVPYDGGFAGVYVTRDAPGIKIIDDWAGFGQRLTASGTATFEHVEVRPELIFPFSDRALAEYIPAFTQFVHSSTQAGIAQRLAEDVADVVGARSRTYPLAPNDARPQDDPQVLQVVGEIASGAYSAKANVLANADALDNFADPVRRARTPDALEAAIVASSATQVVNTRLLGDLSWHFFDAASASTTQSALALDRHWRNARTVSSHNPAIYKARTVGHYLVHGSFPGKVAFGSEEG
ncbi:acyl-CoA dehydrogenase family protein [Frankia sp. QA3]|uniref:acyl-CoA dehydrogenase family protein n=1 Tax=Frankia sp. QA3 TaxID=710111 RepID=UPI000269CEF5|nr:acyl-CoA dehydrogenase family protein [Frankia sp. QA3]EIV96279.1 acyl-CoA dehydrogenase [Frankia sp. QA3]